MSRVIQVGNLIPPREMVENPQEGRVYSTDGIAPVIGCFSGGNKEPKIIEVNDD